MTGRLQAMRPVTVAIGGCSLCPSILNLGPRILTKRHAVEARQKVEVPPVTPEFTIGDALEADRLLPLDCVRDRAVLDLSQRLGIQCARFEACACLGQLRRTQETADVIGS